MSQDSLAQLAFKTKSKVKVNGDKGTVTVYFPSNEDFCILELSIDGSKSYSKASYGSGLDSVLTKNFKKLGYNDKMCKEIVEDVNKKLPKAKKTA